MKLRSAKMLELMARRAELLRALVAMGSSWQKAFIGLRLEESERFAAEEEILCRQLQSVDAQLSSVRDASRESETDAVLRAQMATALERMAALQREVLRGNETRRAILKRSALTIDALRNLFNSYAPTYGAPADSRKGAICEESV